MKEHFSKLLTIALLLVSWACSENKEQVSEAAKTYEWVIADSLDLDFLGNPMLTDVSPDGSKLVFFDQPSSKILITDSEGNLNHSFSKVEDTPDAYGFMLERPGFFRGEQVAVFGMNGLFIYDLEGEMQQKIPHPESLGGAGSMTFIGKSVETATLDGKEYLIPISVRPRNSFPGEQEFYDTYRAIELVDPDAETMTELIPFEEGSHFLNGKGYIQSDYAPAYEAKDGKLYIVHGGDPKLYVYQLRPELAALDTVIQLDIPGFILPEGKDRAEFQEGHIEIRGGTAAFRNIHILDDLILLNYYAGIEPAKSQEAEALWTSGNEEEARAMYQKIESEVPKGTLIYQLSDLSYLGHVTQPDLTGGRTYASGGGFAWFQKTPDPDVEEDFLRVYKMKLVER
ncbi:hypothetical protein PBT90_14760 [Algoriphagus halophytocola]|uniref:DUF4221 domain-containing protein n=1 Tax=Algoriphagus halophytocola TaxID=2991499 RepID=A0ABY6MNB5_9BACT|nr:MULTISPECIES: hypothetical protein [unclassified Algoriphagus]UZD24640.1 hypothetical protein OM944_09095 [Algoriphagus sp. TR-M5]WBL42008.1 hypothetical protein PBT90_14760 [Algoriphagus sp. TR-M9]